MGRLGSIKFSRSGNKCNVPMHLQVKGIREDAEITFLGVQVKFSICYHPICIFFFLISNKILLKRKKSHPRTQGVYKGEQIKNENYKSQVNPKEIKKGFSKQRTIQVMFGKREA